MQCFFYALCCDQVSVSQLVSFELLARRAQMIEIKYRDRSAGGATTGGADPFEDVHLYSGVAETRSGLAICPAWEKWAGLELKDEFKASEARRKAHEERLARKNKLKKSKKDKDEE